MGEPHPVSAAHGQGIRSLLDAALEGFDFGDDAAEAGDEDADKPIRLAVAGRPNVGKSTLINTWLGEERLVAFDQPGTTRDAIHVPFERDGQHFELIDTAGLRRKGRVFEAIEKFSVVKTLQAIADANVVVLLLDATQGVTDQDAHIAGYILDSGPRRGAGGQQVGRGRRLPARDAASARSSSAWPSCSSRHVLHISALKRQGLGPLWKAIAEAHASATRKMPTPVLTRLLHEAVEHQAPKRAGTFRPKLRYAHQGGHEPADRRGPRQLARARDRRLQALPRRPLPRALQAGRHAAAHRDEDSSRNPFDDKDVA